MKFWGSSVQQILIVFVMIVSPLVVFAQDYYGGSDDSFDDSSSAFSTYWSDAGSYDQVRESTVQTDPGVMAALFSGYRDREEAPRTSSLADADDGSYQVASSCGGPVTVMGICNFTNNTRLVLPVLVQPGQSVNAAVSAAALGARPGLSIRSVGTQ